jgi:hypothetical protein
MYNLNMTMTFRSFIVGATFIAGALLITPSAQAATITVCAVGCDYTTLNDAISADVPGQDTYLLDTGYTYVFPPESNFISLPDDTILTCSPGVVFGDDLGGTANINPGNNTLIQECTFENTQFDATGKSLVSWVDNVFSENTYTSITLTESDGFTIANNTNLNHLQIQNADNGFVASNEFNCRFSSNCITLATAGGGPFDYTDPADVPNDIVFSNNVITNYNTITGGDFVYFAVGLDIEFTNNTLQSVETMNSFITMFTVQNVHATISGNYFFYPPKEPLSNNGTWGLNVRVADGDTTIEVENNSFIGNPDLDTISGDACLGVFDDENDPSLKQVTIIYRYNLCYNANPNVNDNGISLGYGLATVNVNLTDAYNGFYQVDNLINDSNGVYTDLDPTTIQVDPVFRTENANPNDDYHLVPMSRYLDIDGSRDIGAFSSARISTYLIDDDCVVDYLSCHSQFTTTIANVVKSGDDIEVAAGNYAGLAIEGPLTDITLTGAGDATIFDGALNFQSALSLEQVTSSQFSSLRLINSTDTSVITYPATLPILSFGGNDYDDSDVFGGPPSGVYFIPDLACNAELITADGDIVSIDGASNINAGLADVGGSYVTLLFHDLVADNLVDAQNNLCGGIVPFTHFIEDMFVANGDGTYTYNATNLTNQGITLAAGMTFPPSIGQTIARGYFAGLRLDNSNNNHFTGLTIDNNDLGISLIYGSASNTLETLIITNSNAHDVISATVGANDLLDPSFDRTTSEIEEGTVRVRYRSIVEVTDALFNPLQDVLVDFVSQNGLTNVSATTDVSGATPIVDSVAYLMTTSSISLTNGGYNLFTITANATGTYATTSTPALLNGVSIFQLIMTLAPVVVPVPPPSGGGGLPSIDPRTGLYQNYTSTPIAPLPNVKNVHQLVKLKDDGNTTTQHDSTVYYLGADGKRHAFPNPSVYGSWYCDFSQILIVSESELASYQLGKNVTYRPGLRLVKFPTNPRVYVVQGGRMLRPIQDEGTAITLFGSNWAKRVSDIEDTFYNDYLFGEVITSMTDKAFLDITPSYPSAEMSIFGYQDIIVSGVSSTCTHTPPQSVSTSASIITWPFATIPVSFTFNVDLSPSSSASTDIRYLQEYLASKGSAIYPDGRVTGIYGELTTQAVKNFQRSKGISETGTVGPLTRSAINKELNDLR